MVDWDETEMAEQLFSVEHHTFTSIHARELLVWVKMTHRKHKDRRAQLCPNIGEMIDRFNAVSRWTQYCVLSSDSHKARRVVYKKLVRVAYTCGRMHNFHSTFAIYAGLQASAVHRLGKVTQLNGKEMQDKRTWLLALMDTKGNRIHYRRTLQATRRACVPYLGAVLSDLSMVLQTQLALPPRVIDWNNASRAVAVIKQTQTYQRRRRRRKLEMRMYIQAPSVAASSRDSFCDVHRHRHRHCRSLSRSSPSSSSSLASLSPRSSASVSPSLLRTVTPSFSPLPSSSSPSSSPSSSSSSSSLSSLSSSSVQHMQHRHRRNSSSGYKDDVQSMKGKSQSEFLHGPPPLSSVPSALHSFFRRLHVHVKVNSDQLWQMSKAIKQ